MLLKTLCCTGLALLAFAANSVLCRLALGEQAIDAISFTTLRLMSAVVVLFLIVSLTGATPKEQRKGSWSAALMLFIYALTFSLAYNTLDTGTGALILFGFVQITMIIYTFIRGQRLHTSEWLGLLLAFAGMVYLIYPDMASPSLMGFVLMGVAGVTWGMYSIQGKKSLNPLMDTAHNFLKTLPLILVVLFMGMQEMHYSGQGVMLALLSGGIASGIGYTIWYIALADLTAMQAAIVQLAVPAIAAVGGVVFVAEVLTLRLVLSSCLILGGILVVILGKRWFGLEREKHAKN